MKGIPVLLLGLCAGVAQAVPVTFLMSGTFGGGSPTVNDPFRGQHFDAILTVDETPLQSSANHAQYIASSTPGGGFQINVNGVTGFSHAVSLDIYNDYPFINDRTPHDGVFLTVHSDHALNELGPNEMFMRMFWHGPDTAIDSTALLPDPNAFNDLCYEIEICTLNIGPYFAQAGFSMTDFHVAQSASVITVDSPQAPILLALGILALAWPAWRRACLT